MILNALLNRPGDLAREMDRLFESMTSAQPFGLVGVPNAPWSFPALNLWEDGQNLYAEAELPGMTMQDVEVLVTGDQLTVKGTRTGAAPQESRLLRRERLAGSFERTIGLPVPIDTERVEARLTNGVLAVTMPKAAQCLPRKVEVRKSETSAKE